MGNTFLETKKLMSKEGTTFTGRVTSKIGNSLKVLSDTGIVFNVFGDFSIGTYVYVNGTQVLGAVVDETVITRVID